MKAWINNGTRLDIELSVALEVGAERALQANNAAEREAAAAFNLALWQVIGTLATTAPDIEDREALVHCAEGVIRSRGRDFESIVRCNRTHAGRLAGRAASNGTLKTMVEEWTRYRQARRGAVFTDWLIERFDSCANPALSPA